METLVAPRTLQQDFGDRVHMRRRLLGLTQRELGARVGWQQDYVSVIERGSWGQIDPGRLRSLACILGVSSDYLLGLAEAP